jgi:hypothetical protein
VPVSKSILGGHGIVCEFDFEHNRVIKDITMKSFFIAVGGYIFSICKIGFI